MMGRKYTKELLEEAVKRSFSKRELCLNLGVNICGGTVGMISARIKEYGLDISHFRRPKHSSWNKGHRKKTPAEILVLRESGGREKTDVLRRAMIESGIAHKCSECPTINSWNAKKLVLQIDHVNGNPRDDRLENLRFLCPNCHSQTDNWTSKNRR